MVVKCENKLMSANRKVFDSKSLKMHQKRSKILGFVDFVDKFAIDQVVDVLSDINKDFKEPAIVGGKASFWAKNLGINNALLIDDGETLDFFGKKFDLIIHALSLHWCNDPVGQLIQVRQALKPDGLMLAFLLGGETLCELRTAFEAAELKTVNGISPRVAPMIAIRDAGDLLVRSGFSLNVADITDLEVTYKNPMDLLYDLRGMGETSIMYGRQKNILKRSTLNALLEIYSNDYKTPSEGGRVKATFQVLCLTGWAPADNQQKPLRRGSATHHFSEILDTYKL